MISTKRTRLRPVQGSDTDLAAAVLAAAPAWRGPGPALPGYVDPHRVLFDRVDAQAVIERIDSSEPAGIVQLVAWDVRTSSAELSVGLLADAWMRVWPLEGVVAFTAWSFREFELDSIRVTVSDGVLGRHGLRLDRWATREHGSTGGTSRWRIDRRAWNRLHAGRLVALKF